MAHDKKNSVCIERVEFVCRCWHKASYGVNSVLSRHTQFEMSMVEWRYMSIFIYRVFIAGFEDRNNSQFSEKKKQFPYTISKLRYAYVNGMHTKLQHKIFTMFATIPSKPAAEFCRDEYLIISDWSAKTESRTSVCQKDLKWQSIME